MGPSPRGFWGIWRIPTYPLRGPVWVPHASRFLGASESSESVYEHKREHFSAVGPIMEGARDDLGLPHAPAGLGSTPGSTPTPTPPRPLAPPGPVPVAAVARALRCAAARSSSAAACVRAGRDGSETGGSDRGACVSLCMCVYLLYFLFKHCTAPSRVERVAKLHRNSV